MTEEPLCHKSPNKMLVILAHPDDESFAVGGTLAKFSQKGICTILLCATRGEAGIPGVSREEAGILREHELRKAAEHLGIEVHFLGYQDGELDKTDSFILMEHVNSWISLVQPQVILTFGPDGVSGHSDHVTISRIVTQAFDQYYQKGVLLYIHPSEATLLGCGVSSSSNDEGKPLISIDVSKYKLEKIQAIQSHISQNQILVGKPEEEVEKIPCHENYVVARDKEFDDCSQKWLDTLIEN